MKVTDVYKQYFAADCVFNGAMRRGASVCLTATSCDGEIKYEVSVSFFPHDDETDFRISGDAFACDVLYSGRGRRSKKREADFLGNIRGTADALAARLGGTVFWDEPLAEARYG